jgi:hypothetical protein
VGAGDDQISGNEGAYTEHFFGFWIEKRAEVAADEGNAIVGVSYFALLGVHSGHYALPSFLCLPLLPLGFFTSLCFSLIFILLGLCPEVENFPLAILNEEDRTAGGHYELLLIGSQKAI